MSQLLSNNIQVYHLIIFKTSESYKQHQLTTARFVTSQHGNIGPWKVMEGLPTLEDHRDLPIEVQAKHLLMTGLIDDIIISNAYATDEELYALSKINLSMPTLNIELNPDISNLEKRLFWKKSTLIVAMSQTMLFAQQ